ncbi:MAG: cytochrome P450 [Proteobacteria bacterium]|jgi:cytochrome P450|nr:cytochrome P450 [Pseudomonadota bacterium]
MAAQSLNETNPLAPDILTCPYSFDKQLREQAPVYHCPITGVYFVSDYEKVVEVAKNEQLFSNEFAQFQAGLDQEEDPELAAILKKGYRRVETMLKLDPPLQRRYRALCQKPFSASQVAKLQPYIQALANELIDDIIDKGQCNWMEAFAVPMPVRMIAFILGVPLTDLDLFKQWSDASVYRFAAGKTREGALQAAQLTVDFQHYFADKIKARQIKPTEDVLSDIVNASVDGEHPMNLEECLSVISQLLVAGNETTTSTFAEGMHLLATHPDQVRLVQEDPSLIPNMVEEMLRLSTPTAQMWRICKSDTEVHGVKIPAGAAMMIKFASANRDAKQFPEPDRFDVTRDNSRTQIAFGQGVHHCLGAALARQELMVGFQVILQRLTNFRLPKGEEELEFLPSTLLHPPKGLNLLFDPRD